MVILAGVYVLYVRMEGLLGHTHVVRD